MSKQKNWITDDWDELFDGGHDEMTLDGYMDQAMDFAVYNRFGFNDIFYPAMGLAGEAGEIANKVKKLMRDEGVDWTSDDVYEQLDYETARDIAAECGDCLWYIAALVNDLGYSLEEVAHMNIEKLSGRRRRGVIKGKGDLR